MGNVAHRRRLQRLGKHSKGSRANAGVASIGDRLCRFFKGTWRWYPILAFAVLGLMYLFQFLLAPSTNIPLGSTATMTVLQGRPVLVTVRSFSLSPWSQTSGDAREARFYVEMRMRDPWDSMSSADALASYCSVLSDSGVVYPSDLSRSSPRAAQGIFELTGRVAREGWVVAYVPANVRLAGITCQLGDDVENWLLR